MEHHCCEDTLRRLDDYLDRELSPAEIAEISSHLEDCAACAEEVEVESRVLREVREKLRRIALPPDLMKRICAKLTEQKV